MSLACSGVAWQPDKKGLEGLERLEWMRPYAGWAQAPVSPKADGFLGLGGRLATPDRQRWLGSGLPAREGWPSVGDAGQEQLPAACAVIGAPLRASLHPGMVSLLLQSLSGRKRFVLVPEAGDVYAETSE
ncbi:hypothetical protein WISP_93976 [Willisornis vidua]|uniref:Uncharacterized protein n=1 Tax=Willisornis vidua TaxID=1566151 RepID=A0ABQ9D572_9PASS|nr:hypothetical protein WISP_93976 [Willisornis vidua]